MLYFRQQVKNKYRKVEEEAMTIQEEIQKLKEDKQAVILAHYYVRPEVQEIADYIGDSFYLSKIAEKLENPVIVYCGVSFMGESGYLLCPDKKVLMPDIQADCPMAHMVLKEEIAAAREAYEDLAVVCYINSTAEAFIFPRTCKITSFGYTPFGASPSSRTSIISGTRNHSSPVISIVAISVAPHPVPIAPNAP